MALFDALPLANANDLIRSIAALISAIAWPLVMFVLLLRFGPRLGHFFAEATSAFFARMNKVTLAGGGVHFSAEAQAAVVALANADEASNSATGDAPVNVEEIVATVGRAVQVTATHRPPEILWVDDRPENNQGERRAMTSLGMRVTLALSTEEALEKLRSRRFDVVISDMGRPPDPQAGYTLLDAMRAAHDTTPFVIYAGSNAPQHRELARKHGALGSTNRPAELIDLVLRAGEARQ